MVKRSECGNDLYILDSGEETLDFLYHRGKCGNTPSDSHEHILDGYNLHANGYLKKPLDLPKLKNVVEGVGEYRFVICKRPPKGR